MLEVGRRLDGCVLEGFNEEQTNVIAVRGIKIRRKDREIATKHLVLTFNSTTLPDNVHRGYLNLRVRPHVPNPRRCFHCQRYGHTQQSCRGKLTCALCASTEHGDHTCDVEDVQCVNCSSERPACSRKCPCVRQEKELLAIKVKENVSFQEAKRRLALAQKGSFAEVARHRAGLPQFPAMAAQATRGNCTEPQPLNQSGRQPSHQKIVQAPPLRHHGRRASEEGALQKGHRCRGCSWAAATWGPPAEGPGKTTGYSRN